MSVFRSTSSIRAAMMLCVTLLSGCDVKRESADRGPREGATGSQKIRGQVFANVELHGTGRGTLGMAGSREARPVHRPWHACQGDSRLQGRETLGRIQLSCIEDARRVAAVR